MGSKSKSRLWIALGFAGLVLTLGASQALASPVTVNLTYVNTNNFGPGTASVTVVVDHTILHVPGLATGGPTSLADLYSCQINISGLATVPATTSFTESDLAGWWLGNDPAGDIFGVTFWAPPNSDAYQLFPPGPNVFQVRDVAGAPIAEFQLESAEIEAFNVPALSTYGIAAMAVLLALAGVVLVYRRL